MSHMDLSEDELSSDNVTTSEESGSEESSGSSESDSDEVEEINIWRRMQDEAIEKHNEELDAILGKYNQNGDSDEVAEAKAINDLIPVYRKELREVLLEHLKWMHQLKKDPTFKKIMETKKNLMDNDGYDWEEATELAIHKRKFLLNKMFAKVEIPKQSTVKNERFHPYAKKFY